MGKTCEWSCPSCGGSWRLNLGHGIAHALPEAVASEFPAEMGQEILSCAGKEQWPVFHFNFLPARCADCYTMMAVPHIEFPKQKKRFTGGCKICRKPLVCEADVEKILCPRCGKAHMKAETVGQWD